MSPSAKRRLVGVAALLAVVLCGTVAWQVCRTNPTEARFGRLLGGPSTGPYGNYLLQPEARKEIGGMGTNALPYLIHAVDLNCQDSRFDRFLRRTRIPPWVRARCLPLPRWELREHIADAFGALGPASAAAVPELAKRLSRPETAQLAAEALAAVGRSAKAAVPEMVAAYRSTNPIISNAGAFALQAVDPEVADRVGLR
jgi:hypothetical protein